MKLALAYLSSTAIRGDNTLPALKQITVLCAAVMTIGILLILGRSMRIEG
jgi:hypothetical protein